MARDPYPYEFWQSPIDAGPSPTASLGDAPRDLRDALGRFATGVTVVTTMHDGRIHGATVGSFTSISWAPPLIMVSIGRGKRLALALAGPQPFTVNVLAAHQGELARHFSGQRAIADPGAIVWDLGAHGPRLDHAVVRLGCRPWARHDGGDHVMVLGRVEIVDGQGGDPLISHRGALGGLGQNRQETP